MHAARFRFLSLLAALFIGTAVLCAGCSADRKGRPTDDRPVVVSVEVVPAAATPGDAVTLVWRFSLADGWHLYWPGRNDSGYPPRIDLTLPDGWVAGGLQWPVPERYVSAGDILDHVYFEELVLMQTLGAPAKAEVGREGAIRADIQWLACKDMCVPGKETLSFPVPVKTTTESVAPSPALAAAGRLPDPLPENLLETRWEGPVFHIHRSGARLLTFMPTADCGRLVDLLHDGQGERLALRFKPQGDTVGPVRGLITIEDNRGQASAYRIDFPASALAEGSSGG
jgi:thiol:disulfide interchange protein DsbD